jgi:hypothetical protein
MVWFWFFCRASYRVEDEYRHIAFLCPRLPTKEEYEELHSFPDLIFIVGDPRRKTDLLKAGINGASHVIIMDLHNGKHDDFSDTGVL